MVRAAGLLHSFEQLEALGWRLSLRTFVRLRRWAFGLAVLVSVAAAKLLVSLFADDVALILTLISPARLQVTLLAGLMYWGAACVARDLFTRRRDVVGRSANRPFFRGLDLPAWAVFTVLVALPVIRAARCWWHCWWAWRRGWLRIR